MAVGKKPFSQKSLFLVSQNVLRTWEGKMLYLMVGSDVNRCLEEIKLHFLLQTRVKIWAALYWKYLI